MSKIKAYYISDWIGNVLDFRGKFTNPQFSIAKKFKTFDDAEDWLSECWGDKYEENRQDVYIMEIQDLNELRNF